MTTSARSHIQPADFEQFDPGQEGEQREDDQGNADVVARLVASRDVKRRVLGEVGLQRRGHSATSRSFVCRRSARGRGEKDEDLAILLDLDEPVIDFGLYVHDGAGSDRLALAVDLEDGAAGDDVVDLVAPVGRLTILPSPGST